MQYPDTITVTVVTPATQDSDLNWIEGTETTYTLACRLEPNGSGRQVMGDDGVLRDYAYKAYLPPMTTVIPSGTAYTAVSLNNGTITGTVKRPHNGQLNSQLWL